MPRSETGFVILSKFWSRYDLQNFRKQFFLVDDQGDLNKGTVHPPAVGSYQRKTAVVVSNLVVVSGY